MEYNCDYSGEGGYGGDGRAPCNRNRWPVYRRPGNYAAQHGFYQSDHLDTPQELVDESGNVVWLGRYNAWGGVKAMKLVDVGYAATDNARLTQSKLLPACCFAFLQPVSSHAFARPALHRLLVLLLFIYREEQKEQKEQDPLRLQGRDQG